MIVTVTPNPALDLTWQVDRLERGATHRLPRGRARAGGKGLNVARVAHQQGYNVRAITTVGGVTGTEFASELMQSNVPHTLVPVEASTRRSMALHDTGNDETSIFNEFGDAPSDAEWRCLLTAMSESLATARCVVGSGSLPSAGTTASASFNPATFYPLIVAMATARGIPSIIDTSGAALLAAADAGATVLKPNSDELMAATGIDDPILAARSLIVRGAALVLLSRGSAGMIAISASDPLGYLSARLPLALEGNPTGAGDAAVAAIASVLAPNAPHPPDAPDTPFVDGPRATLRTPAGDTIRIETILRRATAWSAAAVLMPLAGEISPAYPELSAQLIVEYHVPTPSAATTTSPTENQS